MGRPGCPFSQTILREDAEYLSNPNLVDLTFFDKHFPNFGSHRVQDFWTIQQISCVQLWLGRNSLRYLM